MSGGGGGVKLGVSGVGLSGEGGGGGWGKLGFGVFGCEGVEIGNGEIGLLVLVEVVGGG